MPVEDFMTPPEGNVLVMSHSEVDTYNDCHKKHDYAHRARLEPAELNDRLMLGTIGHSGLEHYYRAIQFGESHEAAAAKAEEVISEMYAEEHLTLVVRVIPMLRRYFAHYGKEDFKVLYVEQEFYLPIETIDDTKLYFAMKPDLIVQKPYRRGFSVIDHKFVARFYSGEAISMMPQMVRYSAVLSTILNQTLQDCTYNEVHTQPAKTNPKYLERAQFQPSMARVRNTWDDTITTMREIYYSRKEDRKLIRQPGPMKCNFCLFEPLCNAELNGTDTTLMRKVNYRPSTYGYGLSTEAI